MEKFILYTLDSILLSGIFARTFNNNNYNKFYIVIPILIFSLCNFYSFISLYKNNKVKINFLFIYILLHLYLNFNIVEIMYVFSILILILFSYLISLKYDEEYLYRHIFIILILYLASQVMYALLFPLKSFIGGRLNGYEINSINIGYASFFICIYTMYHFINNTKKIFYIACNYFSLIVGFLVGSRLLVFSILIGNFIILYKYIDIKMRVIISIVIFLFISSSLYFTLPFGFRHNYENPILDRIQQVDRSINAGNYEMMSNNKSGESENIIDNNYLYNDVMKITFGSGFSLKNKISDENLSTISGINDYNIYNDPHNLIVYMYKSIGIFGLICILFFLIMFYNGASYNFPFFYLISLIPSFITGGSLVSIINLSDWLFYISIFYVYKKK